MKSNSISFDHILQFNILQGNPKRLPCFVSGNTITRRWSEEVKWYSERRRMVFGGILLSRLVIVSDFSRSGNGIFKVMK